MSFGAGFVTGFANTLAEGMLERQKEARDYFNKQVDYARTTGLQNRKKTRQAVDANLVVAKQLEASGVPRDLIMAQINADPYGLESFAKQAETMRAEVETERGTTLSPDEWKAIFKVAGDFKAPDEDLATFISRTYDPIAHAVKDESFSQDPEGTLISSLLGFDQMDRARAGLGRTEIAEGLTAEQLIRYGDVEPQRQGGSASIVTDYTKVPQKPNKEKDGGLGVAQVLPVTKEVDDDIKLRIGRVEGASGGKVTPEELIQIKKDAVEDYFNLYSERVPREQFEVMVDRTFKALGFNMGETAPESAPTGPLAPEVDTGSPEVQTPSTASPEAPVDEDLDRPIDDRAEPSRVSFTAKIEGKVRTVTLVRDNGDGSSTYMDEEGEDVKLPNRLVRTLIKP